MEEISQHAAESLERDWEDAVVVLHSVISIYLSPTTVIRCRHVCSGWRTAFGCDVHTLCPPARPPATIPGRPPLSAARAAAAFPLARHVVVRQDELDLGMDPNTSTQHQLQLGISRSQWDDSMLRAVSGSVTVSRYSCGCSPVMLDAVPPLWGASAPGGGPSGRGPQEGMMLSQPLFKLWSATLNNCMAHLTETLTSLSLEQASHGVFASTTLPASAFLPLPLLAGLTTLVWKMDAFTPEHIALAAALPALRALSLSDKGSAWIPVIIKESACSRASSSFPSTAATSGGTSNHPPLAAVATLSLTADSFSPPTTSKPCPAWSSPAWLSTLTSLHITSPSLGSGVPWLSRCPALTTLQLTGSCLTSLLPLHLSGSSPNLHTLAFHYSHPALSEPDHQILANCVSLRLLRLQPWASSITAAVAAASTSGSLWVGDPGGLPPAYPALLGPLAPLLTAVVSNPAPGIRRALDLNQPLPLLPQLQTLHVSLRDSHQLLHLQHLPSLTALHFGLAPCGQGWGIESRSESVQAAWSFLTGLPLLQELHILQGNQSLPLVQHVVTLLAASNPRLYSLQYSGVPDMSPRPCVAVSPGTEPLSSGGGCSSSCSAPVDDGMRWPDLSCLTGLRVLALGSGPYLHGTKNDGKLPELDVGHLPADLLRLSLYGTELLLPLEDPSAAKLPGGLMLCSIKDCNLRWQGARGPMVAKRVCRDQAGTLCSLLATSCPGLQSLTYYSTTNSNPKSTGQAGTATHTHHFPATSSHKPPASAYRNSATTPPTQRSQCIGDTPSSGQSPSPVPYPGSWLQLSSLQCLTELDLELEYEATRITQNSVDLNVGGASSRVDDSASSIPARTQRAPDCSGVSGSGRRLLGMDRALGGGGDVEEAGSLAEVVSLVVKLPWLRKLRLASDSMHMVPDCQVTLQALTQLGSLHYLKLGLLTAHVCDSLAQWLGPRMPFCSLALTRANAADVDLQLAQHMLYLDLLEELNASELDAMPHLELNDDDLQQLQDLEDQLHHH